MVEDSTPLGALEVYNPATNAWTTLLSMPTARFDLAAVTTSCPPGMTGSCIYAMGGVAASGVTDAHEAFDPPPSDGQRQQESEATERRRPFQGS
jgi:kelch-like protein 8/kelch-like protein 20